jgi:hypothetical protein
MNYLGWKTLYLLIFTMFIVSEASSHEDYVVVDIEDNSAQSFEDSAMQDIESSSLQGYLDDNLYNQD